MKASFLLTLGDVLPVQAHARCDGVDVTHALEQVNQVFVPSETPGQL